MAISIRELAGIPYLGMRLHAGERGADRRATWAHTCEIPNPWDVLVPGEMLLCNGLGLPADDDGQAEFLRRLEDAGVVALGVGIDVGGPELTPALRAAADELAFPVLLIGRDIRFAAIERAVAQASQGEEQGRLVKAARIYDGLRLAMVRGETGAALLRSLGDELRCRLHVLDAAGASVLPDAPEPSAALREAVLAAMEDPWPVKRLDGGAVALPVPASEPGVVLAVEPAGPAPDLFVLEHAATVAALEVEKRATEVEQRRRTGGELLAQLMAGPVDADAARARLADHGLGAGPWVLAASRSDADDSQALHHRLDRRRVPHLMLHADGVLHVLGVDEGVVGELDGAVAGIADAVPAPGRMPDAAREARWALHVAETDGEPLVRYGDASPSFLPRTVSEAEQLVERLLGPVIAYDAEHGTELERSLEVFLRRNRSWQRAAGDLHVHKQTLVYRIRRVEELTGRRLDSTDDVARLWLALQARSLVR